MAAIENLFLHISATVQYRNLIIGSRWQFSWSRNLFLPKSKQCCQYLCIHRMNVLYGLVVVAFPMSPSPTLYRKRDIQKSSLIPYLICIINDICEDTWSWKARWALCDYLLDPPPPGFAKNAHYLTLWPYMKTGLIFYACLLCDEVFLP